MAGKFPCELVLPTSLVAILCVHDVHLILLGFSVVLLDSVAKSGHLDSGTECERILWLEWMDNSVVGAIYVASWL